jgi:hypothetical protein
MAFPHIRRSPVDHHRVRYDAWYRDASGQRHSTETFLKRREAAQAARDAEAKIAARQ